LKQGKHHSIDRRRKSVSVSESGLDLSHSYAPSDDLEATSSTSLRLNRLPHPQGEELKARYFTLEEKSMEVVRYA